MKVLIITPRASGVSGVAQHVRSLIKGLLKRGFRIDLLSCENTFHLPFKGARNFSFSLSSSFKTLLHVPYPPVSYDVVHAHNIPSALAMKTAWAEKRILTLHGVFSEQVEELHRWLPPLILEKLEVKALSWADAITAVSEEAVRHYKRLGFTVHRVPNAIDLQSLPSRGVKMHERQVVYVGRLSREKGVDLLVEAFKKIPSIHLLLIGEGPEESKLKKAAKGYNNIHFLGPLPREKALTYVKGSDLLVQPSRKEGLSTALLEAMAMGTPVIATRVGGNIELIEHGKTGLLIEPESVTDIIDAISMAFSRPELLKMLSAKAKVKIASEYSWEVVLEAYINLYQGGAH